MKVKESEKFGLKLNIQKTKMMVSGPITSWQRVEETMETERDFILLPSKTTADGDCSHEIKRCLLLGRTAMANLDTVLKSRDITLLTKVGIVKPEGQGGLVCCNSWGRKESDTTERLIWSDLMVFPVVMYACESWTIKKAEHQRIDAFKLWC